MSCHRRPSSSPRLRAVESATTVIRRAVSNQNPFVGVGGRLEHPVGRYQVGDRGRIDCLGGAVGPAGGLVDEVERVLAPPTATGEPSGT